jgi:peptidoglycan hydrolase-like protein with peptidoglycan-binding domain
MSKDIFDQAEHHFLGPDAKFEYGRSDERMKNKTKDGIGFTDSSRTEQDNDHDGYRGVDCSSFVWRGMKNAGYDVGNEPFSTHALFEGKNVTSYSKAHFDVIPGSDAGKRHGDLQPGDIIMFKKHPGTTQHVAIFKDYDSNGNIEFIGSQTSTGPAKVTMTPGHYWEKNWEIVGALRAKPEFKTHEAQPLDGRAAPVPAHDAQATAAPRHAPQPSHTAAPPHTSPQASAMHVGDKTDAVQAMQERLNQLGYKDERGHTLIADGDFGKHTKSAVERFQREHGLEVDGVVGKHTLDAMKAAQPRAPGIDEAGHPGNPLYKQAQAAVYAVDAQHGRTPDAASDRLAAATAVAAHANGMSRVDHVVLNGDGSKAYAVQGEMNSPFKQLAEVNTQQAVATPVAQSSQQWTQATEQQQAAAHQQAQQQQTRAQPSLTPGAP